MDTTMNLAMTFQMSLDCFLKENKSKKRHSHYEEAIAILNTMQNYRSFEKKVEVAKRAMSICPECIEAYYAYGCYTKECFKKIQRLKQAMEKATLQLGKEFFLQTCEDYYMFEEAHLYFEIKFAYALTLFENGFMKKAKQQLKEIVNLHPGDHYHAHELLYVVYLQLEEETSCKELLKRYQDHNTLYVYVVFLLSIKQCRFEEAYDMLSLMYDSNPYLFAILSNQKLPILIATHTYKAGSEEEASYVYQLLNRVWQMQEGLPQFLNKYQSKHE